MLDQVAARSSGAVSSDMSSGSVGSSDRSSRGGSSGGNSGGGSSGGSSGAGLTSFIYLVYFINHHLIIYLTASRIIFDQNISYTFYISY